MLNRRHPSIQRNPIIADVFHRAGLIEKMSDSTIASLGCAGPRDPVSGKGDRRFRIGHVQGDRLHGSR
jgi:hypothetical protein